LKIPRNGCEDNAAPVLHLERKSQEGAHLEVRISGTLHAAISTEESEAIKRERKRPRLLFKLS